MKRTRVYVKDTGSHELNIFALLTEAIKQMDLCEDYTDAEILRVTKEVLFSYDESEAWSYLSRYFDCSIIQ